jgi:chromatin remodeling complex protein RSC6
MATKQKQNNSKFMKPMQVSDELAKIVGKGPMPRTEVTKKLWAYIKSHKLQSKDNGRFIEPDENLAKVLGSKKVIDMFQMTKLVSKHLS